MQYLKTFHFGLDQTKELEGLKNVSQLSNKNKNIQF